MIIHKDSKARAVLAAIQDMLETDVIIEAEPYVNGRECGFHLTREEDADKDALTGMVYSVAFAENRGSDDIAVYAATVATHAWSTVKGLDKDAYANRTLFNSNDYAGAAKHIIAALGI